MILGKFRISGHSMEPQFKNRQIIIASSLPYLFSKPKKGDAILFNYKKKTFFKRINKVVNDKIYTVGDNKSDSLKIEPIGEKDIIGKIIM